MSVTRSQPVLDRETNSFREAADNAEGRGISETVLVGSTAQRVQHYATCPVLVVRPTPRAKR